MIRTETSRSLMKTVIYTFLCENTIKDILHSGDLSKFDDPFEDTSVIMKTSWKNYCILHFIKV